MKYNIQNKIPLNPMLIGKITGFNAFFILESKEVFNKKTPGKTIE